MKICIIGGGTAGWWTAAYLEHQFPDFNITLFESPSIPTVGVGESTLPQIGTFLEDCGLKDEDWMDESNAVVKYGNTKQYWQHGKNEPFDWTFWYNDNNEFDEWLPEYLNGNKIKDDINKDLYRLAGRRTSGYHLDASLVGQTVKKHCKRINHIETTLDELPQGYDLYIDCTGFRRQFVNDKSVIVPEGHLVNSAWVRSFRVPKGYNINLTQSIARPYGWQFKVGLQHRIGTGYVYCSDMLDDENALEDFNSYTNDMEPYDDNPPRKISWSPEYLENPWSGNVVCIGIGAGFVDPLEANSLYTIAYGIKTLGNCIKRGLGEKAYNRSMRKLWRDNCEFIWHHYALSDRSDTEFWKYYEKIDATKTLWDNYQTKSNWQTNFYADAIWATMGLCFDEFKHYRPKVRRNVEVV